MNPSIPTEVYLAFLGRSVAVNWEYHAALMMGVWFVLVPAGIFAVRFFKAKPTTYGLEKKGVGSFDSRLLCWTLHYIFLYSAIGLSFVGMTVAMIANGGFSGSMHAVWGIAAILFGGLQIVSAWFRGTHGGKNDPDADPHDDSTWRGDHFDMTPRRRWFEAYHKTTGYFTIVLALGAVTSGLLQYWMPSIAIALGVILAVLLGLFIFLEGKGYRQDTYRSVYGNHPDHPFNKMREGL